MSGPAWQYLSKELNLLIWIYLDPEYPNYSSLTRRPLHYYLDILIEKCKDV